MNLATKRDHLSILLKGTVAVDALRIRTTAAFILETTALAGCVPKGIKLNITQRLVLMLPLATPTFSTQEKPVTEIKPFHPFNHLWLDLQRPVHTDN
jgi:hypothetical protein